MPTDPSLQVIGILTLADLSNANYGAFMQAWALKTAIGKVAAANHATDSINSRDEEGGGY